ncbi:MAG: cytidylate kinase-like family protein [Candidatus Zixiibacteriota bacterium]
MTSIDAIINRQLMRWELERNRALENPSTPRPPILPIVTISRQTGSRGSYFGSRLAQKLGYQRLHRDVVEAITRESGYFKRVVESLDEHVRSSLDVMVEGFFSGHAVDNADYIRNLSKVVLSMSELGGVILMGRGGNFILGMNRGFHIRFVAPVQSRIENLVKYSQFIERHAAERIKESDQERKEFIKKLFNADIDDPTRYDMVINSERMDVEDLLEVVTFAIRAKMNKLSHMREDGE